jgi:hypothetical protein
MIEPAPLTYAQKIWVLDLSIFKLYAIPEITEYVIRRGVGRGIMSSRQETGKKMQGEQARDSSSRTNRRGKRREA